MKSTWLVIPEVLLFEPRVFGDERGFFFESFNQREFESAVGKKINFVQSNHLLSIQHVLRVLHYPIKQAQRKLVRVVKEVFDVAVDIRRSSFIFGQWMGDILGAEKKKQIWVPAAFAHGFIVLSEYAEFLYDATFSIDWPFAGKQIPAEKDARGITFSAAEVNDWLLLGNG
ncbi:MAG: dTDP-4-dehydrorhamnose 3,5-epimerase [Nitrosomonas sp.]|nr:dTDP-4-dehydrorhamnose 3,5-epimerase [Nitrosomonas sp.]